MEVTCVTFECQIFLVMVTYTVLKINFSIEDFFNKCDQIRSFLRIWSHLLNKSLIKNFIVCAVESVQIKFSKLQICNCYQKINEFIQERYGTTCLRQKAAHFSYVAACFKIELEIDNKTWGRTS